MTDQPYAVKIKKEGKWQVASTHYNRMDAGTAAADMLNFAILTGAELEAVKVVYDPAGKFEE